MDKLNFHERQNLPHFFQELSDYCANNEVDYDQYGTGIFLNQFESEMAELTGFERGLFLPSGVMAQLIAIKIWAKKSDIKRFCCHETCHLIKHEEDAYKELLNLDASLIGEVDKVIHLTDLKNLEAQVSSLIYELPMRHLGGDLPEFEEWKEINHYCHSHNIKLHVDGARLFEAATYYRKPVIELLEGVDSLFLSFYKGIGSTSGSMLLGSKEFIDEAKIWLRRFGGNLYQLFPLAVPAKMQFEKNLDKFNQWTKKAIEIGDLLKTKFDLQVIPPVPKTNMFHVYFPMPQKELKAKLNGITDADVKMSIWSENEKGASRVEFTVGTATMKLSLKRIEELFKQILD